uniref:Uncharacterized protein AlNc14C133G7018 n=1 Tax=Albugo laibachii Nc14 TaxID=890382 RepID=F0WKG7_9STRA|nr:conserved hypothetical protein [Albugo laibachii Nc14]|eukprot:CCA21771.1 conserved hypothetical protein [Albugo laibachii Nc14]
MAEDESAYYACDGKNKKRAGVSATTNFATNAEQSQLGAHQENVRSENSYSKSNENRRGKRNPQLWKFENSTSSDIAFAGESCHDTPCYGYGHFTRRTPFTEIRTDGTSSTGNNTNQDMYQLDAEHEYACSTNQMEDSSCDSKLASRVANFAVSDQVDQASVDRSGSRDPTLLAARIPTWKLETIPKATFSNDLQTEKTDVRLLSVINNWNQPSSQKQFSSSFDESNSTWQDSCAPDTKCMIPNASEIDISQFKQRTTDVKQASMTQSSFPLPLSTALRENDGSCDLTSICSPPYPNSLVASPAFSKQKTNFANFSTTIQEQSKPSIWTTENVGSEDLTDILKLAHSLTSKTVSHHIILEAEAGFFAASMLEYLINSLNCFGDVASLRTEFSEYGLIFCTFYEIKTAVRAAKMWDNLGCMPSLATPSKQPISAIREAFKKTKVYFSRPYEASEENSAAVLVQLSTTDSISNLLQELGQVCSQFGEVTRIFSEPTKTLSNSFIVEYNDARDVSDAVRNLNLTSHPAGRIQATRTASPLLDETIIIAFSTHLTKIRQSSVPNTQDEARIAQKPTSNVESTPLAADLPVPTTDTQAIETKNNERSSSKSCTPPQTYSTTQVLRPSPCSGEKVPATAVNSEHAQGPHHDLQAHQHEVYHFMDSVNATHSFGAALNTDYQRLENGHDLLPHPTHIAYPFTHSSQHHADSRSVNKFASTPCTNVQILGNTQNRKAPNAMSDFCLSIENVISGVDCRTTLMIRNIPNKYTQQMLLNEINRHHHGRYDFFYLPIDFKNKCNMGYAFLNFMEPSAIISFHQEFNQQKWSNFNSEKVCAISYARLQGKKAMIARFQNSSLLDKHESYRPLVFVSHGPNRGKLESFNNQIEQCGNHARHGQSAQMELHLMNHYQPPNVHNQRFCKGMISVSSAPCFCPHVALSQCQGGSQDEFQKGVQDSFMYDYHLNQVYYHAGHHDFKYEIHHPIQSSHELGYYQTQANTEVPAFLYPAQSPSLRRSEQSMSKPRFALSTQNEHAKIGYNGVIF